jgi:hypothetical protein
MMPTIVGKRNWVRVSVALAAVGGLSLIGLGWAPNLWMACGFAGVSSLASTAFMTTNVPTLQMRAANEFQGRMVSLNLVALTK